jgi:hypothetical protein
MLKISSLQKEQIDFLRLSKEQRTVVKSTFRSLNSTPVAVSENERILSKGLDEMTEQINAMVISKKCLQELPCYLRSMNITCS